MVREKSIIYGVIAGLALIAFYITIISIFQSFSFALLSLNSLWYLILPLAFGFGAQIGLYTSIKHSPHLTGTVAGTGSISAGSMALCCSHFLLNLIPFIGFSGLATLLMAYQKHFLVLGIVSNLAGIFLMIRHKRKMKGGHCKIE